MSKCRERQKPRKCQNYKISKTLKMKISQTTEVFKRQKISNIEGVSNILNYTIK